MPTQGASYVMCTALYMMVLYDRARVGPTTKTSDEISIICLFRLILQANPCFALSRGIRVASKSNVDSIPSLSGVLILRCEYKSFMFIKIVFVNPFLPVCLSSSGSDHFNIHKINYQFFSMLFVSSISKLPLFFPPSYPWFFNDSGFLIGYPSY